MAARLMFAFGWTIEYTLSLSWRQFVDLFGLLRRARLDAAIDGVFRPYCAGKYGKESMKSLYRERGSFLLNTARPPAPLEYTPEDLAAAQKRMAAIQAAQSAKLQAALGADNNGR